MTRMDSLFMKVQDDSEEEVEPQKVRMLFNDIIAWKMRSDHKNVQQLQASHRLLL